MQHHLMAILSLAASAAADFDLYHVREVNPPPPDPGTTVGVSVFDGYMALPPDSMGCDPIVNKRMMHYSGDVSGSKKGVRCEADSTSGGCLDVAEPEAIKLMEIHSGEQHFTWYRDRNRDMLDLAGNVIGGCAPLKGPDFFCNLGFTGNMQGARMFRCVSGTISADMI